MNRPQQPKPRPTSFPAGPGTECRCGSKRTQQSQCPHCDVARLACPDHCKQCLTIKERSA
jgi:hypothetical protein